MPLDDLIAKSNLDLKKYSVAVDTWKFTDGKPYALPLDWAAADVYCSVDAPAKAGVSEADVAKMTWNPDDGGTFDKIVARLTVDKYGKRGDEPGLDKNAVATYGIGAMAGRSSIGETTWAPLVPTLGWRRLLVRAVAWHDPRRSRGHRANPARPVRQAFRAVQALAAGDPDGARDAMTAHLEVARARLLDRMWRRVISSPLRDDEMTRPVNDQTQPRWNATNPHQRPLRWNRRKFTRPAHPQSNAEARSSNAEAEQHRTLSNARALPSPPQRPAEPRPIPSLADETAESRPGETYLDQREL